MTIAHLRDSDLSGMRSIEAASGLNRTTVWKYLPAEGETAYGMLHCSERGSGEDYYNPLAGRYEVVGNRSNAWSGTGVTTVKSRETGVPQGLQETPGPSGTQGVGGIAEVLAEGRKRLLDPAVWEALDPSLDIWASRQAQVETKYDCRAAGHRGWALGLLTGLADVTLTMAQIRELLGLSERQTRNVVAQLEEASLATWHRGTGLVELTFTTALVGTYAQIPDGDRADRAAHKQDQHHHERKVLASRRTRHGMLARSMIRFPNPHWTPEVAGFYTSVNELAVAALLEGSMTRRLALAA